MLDYVGDYLRSAVFGAGNLVASLLNFVGLAVGITVIAIITLVARLDIASVALSFLAFLVLLVVTHFGTYMAYADERRKGEAYAKNIRVEAGIGAWGLNHPDPGPDKSSLRLHVFWEVWVSSDVSTNALGLNLTYVYDRHWWEFWRRTQFPETGIPPKGTDTTQYRKRIHASEFQPFRDDAIFEYITERHLPGDPHWLVELVLKIGMPECEYRVPLSLAKTLEGLDRRGSNPPL